jgi:hypothetical protein
VQAYQEDFLVWELVAGVREVPQVQEELAEDNLEFVCEGRGKRFLLGGLERG